MICASESLMDLILCPGCRRAIAADFYACPTCGHDLQSTPRKVLTIDFCVLLALAGIGIILGSILHL
jgi:predicted amidophosphoribosyltransferase